MDEASQPELHDKLHEFSVGSCSNIRPWLVDSAAKNGLGCWGTELRADDMLYVRDVRG